MGINQIIGFEKWPSNNGMIEPYAENKVRPGVISYGVSSYGYDIRVADEFKIFTNVFSAIVDPKNFDPKSNGGLTREMCASFPRIRSPWPVRSNIFEFHAAPSRFVWGRAPTLAVELL